MRVGLSRMKWMRVGLHPVKHSFAQNVTSLFMYTRMQWIRMCNCPKTSLDDHRTDCFTTLNNCRSQSLPNAVGFHPIIECSAIVAYLVMYIKGQTFYMGRLHRYRQEDRYSQIMPDREWDYPAGSINYGIHCMLQVTYLLWDVLRNGKLKRLCMNAIHYETASWRPLKCKGWYLTVGINYNFNILYNYQGRLYRIRRLIGNSRIVSKPRDLRSKFSDRFEIVAEALVEFQNDTMILIINLSASRPQEILR